MLLYVWALMRAFRFQLLVLAAAILFGGIVYAVTPLPELDNKPPPLLTAFYAAWMALLVQPLFSPSKIWYLNVLSGFYPIIGFVVIGEGIVRLALMMSSRREGEKEWMTVMASTHRDHVILCGIGHLGYRVLQELHRGGIPVVVIERSENGRFLAQAKALGVPVLIRDMKEDQSLIDAGVEHARAIIIATNDDMGNLEVALDSRRMNPKIRIVMRLFDQQIAAKISGALSVDMAFSSSALAAPMVAAMSLETKILASYTIGGTAHAAAEVKVGKGSKLDGQSLASIEKTYGIKIVSHTLSGVTSDAGAPGDTRLAAGDTIVAHAASGKLPALAAAAH